MSKKKSSIFPHYKKPISFILFWTLFPGVAAGILVTVIILVIAAIINEQDLRLIGLIILPAAFLFSLIGFIASAVYVFIRFVMSRRKGSG